MPAGRPRKPTTIHLVEGTFRKDRHDRAEPQFKVAEALAPPAWFPQPAKDEWLRLQSELLEVGLLTEVSVTTFQGYCLNYGRAVEAEAILTKKGATMRVAGVERPRPQVKMAKDCWELCNKFAVQLGLPPASSGKVRVEPPRQGQDPLERLKQRKAERGRGGP